MSDWDDPEREPAPRRRYDDDRDREDSPRRRHYDDVRDDYDERFGYRDYRQKVQAPGVALMVVGWLGVVVSIGMMVVAAIILVERAHNPPPPRGGDPAVMGTVLGICGLVSLVACVIVAVGGQRMRECRSWGLALTAAILALSSILLLGLCSIFVVPFGIWALVVLVQPEVKREFERAGRSAAPRRDAWE